MSYVLLNPSSRSVGAASSDKFVVPASDIAPLQDAVQLLAAAKQRLDAIHAQCEEARQAAYRVGYAEGLEAGRTAAAETIAADIAKIAAQAQQERQRLREQVADLAVHVVRRLCTNLGPSIVVPALAERVAQDLLPDPDATVSVHPEIVDQVTSRLAPLSGALRVEGNPALDREACVFETRAGAIYAGLAVQLENLAAAWRAAAARATAA